MFTLNLDDFLFVILSDFMSTSVANGHLLIPGTCLKLAGFLMTSPVTWKQGCQIIISAYNANKTF